MDWGKLYKHQSEPISKEKEVTILQDFVIQTDKKYRPDLVVKDYKKKICLLIDMSVLTSNNISVKEYNKINKNRDLQIEIEKICHLKTNTMSVIVGALGMIKKGTNKQINKLAGSPSLNEIRISLCRTAHQL